MAPCDSGKPGLYRSRTKSIRCVLRFVDSHTDRRRENSKPETPLPFYSSMIFIYNIYIYIHPYNMYDMSIYIYLEVPISV